MLSTWLGRNGIDGAGGGGPIRVGLNDVNAFYDGTQVQIGHNQAPTSGSARSTSSPTRSATASTTTRRAASPAAAPRSSSPTRSAPRPSGSPTSRAVDTPDFLVGEKINLVGSGPIRNMYNPSLVGDPNCYSSSIPGTEVHAAAGPGNHWFYLLAEGTNPTNGQPTSPTCNGTTVTGIGIQTAAKIMYNAMLMKTTGVVVPEVPHVDADRGQEPRPRQLRVFNTVKAAWDAVSVPAQTADPTCGRPAVTVTNPGTQTGSVGAASASFSCRPRRHRAVHLVRPPASPPV